MHTRAVNSSNLRSVQGRFISQDSYKGSAYEPWTQNLYTYTGNNPVNFVDPTGHKAKRIMIDDRWITLNISDWTYNEGDGWKEAVVPEPDDDGESGGVSYSDDDYNNLIKDTDAYVQLLGEVEEYNSNGGLFNAKLEIELYLQDTTYISNLDAYDIYIQACYGVKYYEALLWSGVGNLGDAGVNLLITSYQLYDIEKNGTPLLGNNKYYNEKMAGYYGSAVYSIKASFYIGDMKLQDTAGVGIVVIGPTIPMEDWPDPRKRIRVESEKMQLI